MKKKLAIGLTALLSSGCLFGGVMSLNAMETVGATEANLWMEKGASVRLSEPTGIGFITRINYEYYESLSDKDVITGTIILPTDYLTDNSITTITHETLNEFGADGTFYQDIENDGFKNEATAETDGYYEYRGSLAPLNVKNYDRAFSAVGYIGVKEAGATEYVYEYTSYSETDHSRAVEDVAFNAYVDRTETEQTVDKVEYKYAVSADGTYSPYTADELTILEGYMRDTTVAVADTTIMQKENGVLALSDLETTIESADANFKAATFGNVTRNNKTIVAAATEATEADVSLNGIYNIEVNGTTTYEATGAKIPATMTVSVDVWSEKTKNVMIAADDIRLVGGYTGQLMTVEKYTVGTYTVDGVEGTYYMLDEEGANPEKMATLDAFVAIAKPLHTKQFYQNLMAENPYFNFNVSMHWYFDNTKDPTTNNAGTAPMYHIFNEYAKGSATKNVWHGGTVDLEEFLTVNYANLSAYYNRAFTEIDDISNNKLLTFGRYVDAEGVLAAVKDADGNYVTTTNSGVTKQTTEFVYGYITTGKLDKQMNTGYFTPMTIEMGGMKAVETTELVDRSTVTTITPSLTSDEQKVVDYWMEQGYTISYEFVKRYSDGTPILTGNDLATLGTYSITETTEDGIYYLNVKATKEDVSGVCLQKSYDIYDATSTIVEYENFKHTDSQYAVFTYFGHRSGLYMGANTVRNIGSVNCGITSKFLTADFVQNYDADNTNTPYLLDFGVSTDKVNVTNYSSLTNVGYLDFNWTGYGAQTVVDANSASPHYMYTYILPRHSKAYYENFEDSYGKFAMAYKTNYGFRHLHPIEVENGEVLMQFNKCWSSTGGNYAVGNINMTVSTLVEYYDAFANAKVPMHMFYQAYDVTETSANTRFYEIFFVKN